MLVHPIDNGYNIQQVTEYVERISKYKFDEINNSLWFYFDFGGRNIIMEIIDKYKTNQEIILYSIKCLFNLYCIEKNFFNKVPRFNNYLQIVSLVLDNHNDKIIIEEILGFLYLIINIFDINNLINILKILDKKYKTKPIQSEREKFILNKILEYIWNYMPIQKDYIENIKFIANKQNIK